ncbi:MAG: hypothetical protein IKM39_02220 [Clostridia bacterium]|nr:hypothetical protein [Clostridia bacterium]
MRTQLNAKETLRELCRQQMMMQNHYNRFATCCRSIPLRNEVLNLLQEEHALHSDLLTQLQERGYARYELADREDVDNAKRELKQKGIDIY